MRHLASIQTIKNIQSIDGADKIEKCNILGWEVVIGKSQFKENDFVVYCEVDSIMPDIPECEFLKPKGMRIRTIKLKGQISQGICFPLSILDGKRYPTDTREGIKYNLIEGMDVTPILGVTKFESAMPACLSGIAKGQFPGFIPKTDESRVQLLQNLLDKYIGFGCYISEKVDGSSVTFYYKDNIFGVCSRNLELIENDTNSLWKKAKEHNIEQKLKNIYETGFSFNDPSAEIGDKSLIKGNFALQGEIIGEGIQGNPLKLKGQHIYFYNAFNIDTHRYLDYSDFIQLMIYIDLPTVPIITSDYILSNDIPSIIDIAVRKSILNPNVYAEGIVIRPVLEIVDKSFNKLEHGGRVSFKAINPQYLLKHQL